MSSSTAWAMTVASSVWPSRSNTLRCSSSATVPNPIMLAVVELAGRDVIGDETADQVVAGLAFLTRHQLLDVHVHLDEALRPLLVGGIHVQSRSGVVLEEFEVFGRDAEEPRDPQ